MKKQIRYSPLPAQAKFHNSTAPKVYFSSGFGGGKTYSLCMKAFWLQNMNPGIPGGMLVPSYKMYKRDVLPTIQDILVENRFLKGRDYQYSKTEMVWDFAATRSRMYIFASGDLGDSIRGPNLGWGLINEVTMTHLMSFKHFLARLRHKKAKLVQLAMSGTPEGFNWCYDYFVENPRKDTELIFGSSEENIHVASTYINNLRGSYDKKMQEQYVEGKFVNLAGNQCAWAFNRATHCDNSVAKVPNAEVWVLIDFNVNPMSATLCNVIHAETHPVRGKQGQRVVHAWKTLKLENSDTYAMCREIKKHVDPQSEQVVVFPDPAGRARDTRSRTSDLDILRQEGFTNQRYRSRPNLRAGFLSVNAMIDRGQLVINSNECRDLVADLEQCVFRDGDTFEVDKRKNTERSHWLDGLKNMAEIEFPVKIDRSGVSEERMFL